MNIARLAQEHDRILALAEQYRGQGYRVAVEPSPDEVPGFLAGYQPDLIVSRGGERTVVEVKSRRSLPADAQAREIARRVEGRPGWRFELVIVGDEPAGAMPPSEPQVRNAVAEARRLLEVGFVSPALLSAWAALEASLRLALHTEGGPVPSASRSLLTRAVEEGILSREDYRAATESFGLRSSLAHGLQSDPVDEAHVTPLLDTASRLLDDLATGPHDSLHSDHRS